MKEVSIEQKAKRYDEAFERVKELLSRCKHNRDRITMVYSVNDIESIFPELKKSEDEKIKEDLIQWISDFPDMIWRGHYREDVITWLDKQGKQKSTEHNENEEPKVYETNDDDVITYSETNGYKVIEPKFKVGDWVIDKQGIVHQIANVVENVTCHTYGYDIVGGGYFNDNTEGVRLWTLQDAKEGDVLVDGDNNIGIFKKYEDTDWDSYIYLGCDGKLRGFSIGGCHEQIGTNPATKEQRDLLFSKMKESGYEWDEKKNLKKIKNEITIPFGAKDSELQEATYFIPKGFHAEIDDDKVVIKKGEKPINWSEDDERIRTRLINLVNEVYDNTNYITFLEHKELLAWLEKLDDNVEL